MAGGGAVRRIRSVWVVDEATRQRWRCGWRGGGGVGGCASSLDAWDCRPRSRPFGPDLGLGGPRLGHASEGSLQAAGTFPRCAWAEAPDLDRQVQIGHHLADPRWALRGATCGGMEVSWSTARDTVLGQLPSVVQLD
jgi:hypothetical protein